MTITIEECLARVWNDPRLVCEALSDDDSLHYWLTKVRDDRDPMARNERAWNLIEDAVRYRAERMHEEMTNDARYHEYDDSGDAEINDVRRGQAAAINAGRL